MALEGRHKGFDLTIFIVFGLSWNFYSGYNIAKEVDWAVRLSVCLSTKFFSILLLHLQIYIQIKHTNGFVLSRRTRCRKPIFEFHFCSALKSKIRKKTCFSDWTMPKSFCQYFFNFRSTSKSSTPIHSYRQDEQDGQNRFSNFIFFLVLKSNLEKHVFSFNFGSTSKTSTPENSPHRDEQDFHNYFQWMLRKGLNIFGELYLV